MTVPCEAAPVWAAAAGNSDDARSSGARAARTTGSAARSPRAAEARTPRTHPAEDNACCTHSRTADMESDDHYLQQQICTHFSTLQTVFPRM